MDECLLIVVQSVVVKNPPKAGTVAKDLHLNAYITFHVQHLVTFRGNTQSLRL
jgi:hypothetical protein